MEGVPARLSDIVFASGPHAARRLAASHLVELGHEGVGPAVGPRRFVPVPRKVEGFVRHRRAALRCTAVPEPVVRGSTGAVPR